MANKKFVRIVCIILAALLVFGLVSYVLTANSFAVTQAEIDALQSERDEIRARQTDLREQMAAVENEMTSVIERKTALDEQNELNRQDIALIDEQIALYDEMIAAKQEELDEAIAAEEEQFNHYCSRVRTMEETNSWSYISILLQAESLSDMLSRLNDIMDIIRNDRHIKDEYIAAREYVEEVKAEYEAVQAEQLAKKEELEAEKLILEQQIENACRIIADLEEDIDEYTAAYEANEALESEVQAKIDKKVAELQAQKAAEEAARRAYEESQRKRQQQQAAASGGGGGGGSYSGGAYYWPVQSCTYISSRFGYRVHPIFGTTKYHSGVDIAAGAGATISAAAGGTVSIAEYSDSYGYYVVVYHSNGTTTLYAHMSSMAVSAGQTVSQGQTLGYVGSTGWSTGPHCHFEIRVNGSCVDPLGYFPGIGFTYASDA